MYKQSRAGPCRPHCGACVETRGPTTTAAVSAFVGGKHQPSAVRPRRWCHQSWWRVRLTWPRDRCGAMPPSSRAQACGLLPSLPPGAHGL